MHYKNGRPARVGDFVVGKDYNGTPVSGVVVRTVEGATSCNLYLAPSSPTVCVTAGECVHLDDAIATNVRPVP